MEPYLAFLQKTVSIAQTSNLVNTRAPVAAGIPTVRAMAMVHGRLGNLLPLHGVKAPYPDTSDISGNPCPCLCNAQELRSYL
ncbi:hypothetical protein H5410_035859 [Solanum commersonii]|uniref:Uncharacterized protein n=1 Tax=Solanum commersonii TaxID=4109 RepID=A0A9J5Y1W6_SOLCO|nr:hypothetical protein H5410_035859 [Solanum commersonii]